MARADKKLLHPVKRDNVICSSVNTRRLSNAGGLGKMKRYRLAFDQLVSQIGQIVLKKSQIDAVFFIIQNYINMCFDQRFLRKKKMDFY